MNNKLLVLWLFLAALIKNFSLLPRSIFEADQEYLALSGQAILNGDLTLIGAPTSVGGMFVGPLYNYLVAALLFIFGGHPWVINGLSFFWSALAVPLIYVAGRRLFSPTAGLAAAILSLISAGFVNLVAVPPLLFPLPVLSLLFILIGESHLAFLKKSLLLGLIAGLGLQLHFSAIFFLPLLLITGFAWLLPFSVLISPLWLFEIRHGWFMTKNAVSFFNQSVGGETQIFYRLETFAAGLFDLVTRYSGQLTMFTAMFVTIIFAVVKLKKNKFLLGVFFSPLIFFLIFGGHLLPYYSIIAWPAAFLIWGKLIESVGFGWRRILVVIFLTMISIVNFKSWFGFYPGRSISYKIAALKFIKEKSGNQPIYLSKTIEPAADFGFTYLTGYLDINSSGNLDNPNYTLVVPFDWLGINSDVKFGDIGVTLPKQ